MAWIESHIEIGEHPKVYGLLTALNVRKAEAVGLLHLLWHFTMKFAWRDGDLSRFSHVVIARACGWENDPDVYINALIDSGFLDNDGSLQVHDWHDFAGRLVNDRIYNENKRRQTSVKRRKTPVKRALPTQPTQPTIPNQPDKCSFSFEAIWQRYPKKLGMSKAKEKFKATVKTEQDWADINKALDNYIRSRDGQDPEFTQHGKTWFNNWRDWVSYQEPSKDGMTPALKKVIDLVEKNKNA